MVLGKKTYLDRLSRDGIKVSHKCPKVNVQQLLAHLILLMVN